jgi:hypothetical protein
LEISSFDEKLGKWIPSQSEAFCSLDENKNRQCDILIYENILPMAIKIFKLKTIASSSIEVEPTGFHSAIATNLDIEEICK